MAIQVRRGNYADFDPTKMVAGEFAVCLDNGYVYITLSPGNVIKLGTADSIEDALEQALEYVTDAEGFADNASDSANSAESDALISEVYAVGKQNGSDVSSGSPYYHNNSKYYCEETVGQVENAEAWATGTRGGTPVPSTDPTFFNNSKYYEQTSEAYALGTRDRVDVPTTDPAYHNNSKYYASNAKDYRDQAKIYRDQAEAIVGIGIATPQMAGMVKPDDETIGVDMAGTIRVKLAMVDGYLTFN